MSDARSDRTGDPPRDLTRETEVPDGTPWIARAAVWAIVTGLTGATLLAFAAASSPDSSPPDPDETVVVVGFPLPVPIAAPVAPAVEPPPPAPPTPALGMCPPHVGAGSAAGVPLANADADALDPYGYGHEAIVGGVASPTDARVLAAWSEHGIFLTTDDGRRFARVLDPPGTVTRVAIDCHGTIAALDANGWLGVRDPDGHERWRKLEFLERDGEEPAVEAALAAWAGYLVVTHIRYGDNAMIAVSDDRGASWQFHRIDSPTVESAAGIEIDARGVAHVVTTHGDCTWDGVAVHRLDLRAGTLHSGEAEDLSLWRGGVGHDGTVYAPWCEDTGPGLCALGARDRLIPGGDTLNASDGFTVLTGPHRTFILLVAEDLLLRLTPRGVTSIADVPNDVAFLHADASGRLLGIREGYLVRWSKRRGARVLRTGPDEPYGY